MASARAMNRALVISALVRAVPHAPRISPTTIPRKSTWASPALELCLSPVPYTTPRMVEPPEQSAALRLLGRGLDTAQIDAQPTETTHLGVAPAGSHTYAAQMK